MNAAEEPNSSTKEALHILPDLPRDQNGPVFREPWQAQVFSMTCLLHEKGHFTWSEWAETLGAVIRELSDDTEYYQCWLTALERISQKKGLIENQPLQDRRDAWDKAARATPHGEPIVLDRKAHKT